MPRPGPRPYECVRRAWHSDRHQPIRGSLIKEIFRVANEIHSSSTKQNKEWQEKLPTVVLRAEEIMYSKANSEAEYMDLKTLWERTNDAMNTIIRRDEGSETGQFLQPCIEAALNLGCTPRRASRSQRNCHPTCYLGSGGGEHSHGHASPAPAKSKSHTTYPLFYGSVPPRFDRPSIESLARPEPASSKLGCDLSLRLGPLSSPDQKDANALEPAATRKRKDPRFEPVQGQHLCLRPKLPFRHVTGS